jgi:hypothetical protein
LGIPIVGFQNALLFSVVASTVSFRMIQWLSGRPDSGSVGFVRHCVPVSWPRAKSIVDTWIFVDWMNNCFSSCSPEPCQALSSFFSRVVPLDRWGCFQLGSSGRHKANSSVEAAHECKDEAQGIVGTVCLMKKAAVTPLLEASSLDLLA